MSITEAIALLKANGYRVTKSKPRKKDRVGPTFVARFRDGEVTRMSTYTSLADLDHGRGERLSRAAWASRFKTTPENAPPIVSAHFEQDGAIIASFEDGEWIGLRRAA
jgi:hypothetical protein